MEKPLGASVFLSDLRKHCFPPAEPYENSKCWSLVCQCAVSIHTCFSQAINSLAVSASIRVRSFSVIDFTSIIWDKYLTSKRNLDKQNINWVTLQKDGFRRPVSSDWKFIVSRWLFWLCPDAVQMLSLMKLNNSTGMPGISDPWSHGVLGDISYVFKEKETWLCDITISKTTGPCHTTAEATPRLLETALEGVAD